MQTEAVTEGAPMEPTRGAQSQTSDNATQEISQSVLELVRSRSEQVSLRRDEQLSDHELENEGTLEDTPQEGDSNFLDIVSSFAGAPVEQESVPVNLSPSQSQPPLTQFPESQRFKTPATAGKKRDYNGNVVDTPAVSRNPFARVNQQTPAHGLGLSQAFAQTQAASSPFANVATSVLRSDRPSPSLEVEKHVVHLPTSSPLRPLSEFKRAATEPAERYVPASHSQRLRTGSVDGSDLDANTATQVTDYDGFESGASTLDRQRRARLREARAREQLKFVSSPTSPEKHDPAPERRAPSERPIGVRRISTDSLPSSPPAAADMEEGCEDGRGDEGVSNQFVAEDNTKLLQSETREQIRTSQMPGDHGKAPASIIPDTTRRHEKTTTHSFPPTQPSPTARQTRSGTILAHQKPVSSGPIRIANSQRSVRSTQDSARNFPVASSGDSIEMVPASPENALIATEPSYTPRLQISGAQSASDEDEDVVQEGNVDRHSAHEQEGRDGPPASTVPETSSSCGVSDMQRHSTCATAPIKQANNLSSPPPDVSGQPVLPPRDRKRKRMEDISQEDVLPKCTQTSSVDFLAPLGLDEDPEIAQALASTQDGEPFVPRKRARFNHGSAGPRPVTEEMRSLSNGINANIGHRVSIRNAEFAGEDVENNIPQDHADDAPVPQVEETIAKTPTKLQGKRSAWDMDDSPKPRHAPKIIGPRSQPVTNVLQHKATRHVRRNTPKSVVKTPSTLPSIEEASPDPVATGLASTAPPTSQANTDQVVARNMVFAYFMGRTRAYYPAICVEALFSKQQHKILWPGYDPEDIGDHGICSLDLRVGDVVKVALERYPKGAYIIRGFYSEPTDATSENCITDIYGHSHVVVEHKNSKLPFPKGVDRNQPLAIADIYIDLNTWNRVRTRPFVYAAPEATNGTSGISTPLNRASTPTTPSSRGRHAEKDIVLPISHEDGMFANMVFALSFEDNNTKSQISEMVTQNGGLVLSSSFRELFDDDLKLKGRFNSIGFAALLADRHSRKEKYMQALAFQLPCLSGKWIEASIKKSSLANWQDYLLPAGESAELDGAVRSRVLPRLEVGSSKLRDMVSKRTQFFDESSAIFVQGRGKAEKRTPHLILVQIMGAQGVDKVADLTAAKERLHQVDKVGVTWVFVADKDYAEACRMVKDVKKVFDGKSRNKNTASWECEVADNEFVMQSLIMGRLCSRG